MQGKSCPFALKHALIACLRKALVTVDETDW